MYEESIEVIVKIQKRSVGVRLGVMGSGQGRGSGRGGGDWMCTND